MPEVAGRARVLGYQIEIRRGNTGSWSDRRTFLGQAITGATYANLDNGIEYQIRVRAVNSEGDCGWSSPVSGVPTSDLAPRNDIEHVERFGPHPIGTDDRNFRLLTPGRCRHTLDGVKLDANCSYVRTSPTTGRITLEFDDPSRGSCDVALAYSSLTAGSFIDECFDAGVNTNVPFDRSFRMPRLSPGTDGDPPPPETVPQRAPRGQDEFDDLVFGRDDFIPGLCFGSCLTGVPPQKSVARVLRLRENGGVSEALGDYTYANTGPSQGVVTLWMRGGGTWTITLDFEPWGNVRATIVDNEGRTETWPGTGNVDVTLGAQPILLPIPPSWSAAIAVETDYTQLEWLADAIRYGLDNRFFADLDELNSGPDNTAGPGDLQFNRHISRVGRNRFVYIISFPRKDPEDVYGRNEAETSRKRALNGTVWTFVVTNESDEWSQYSVSVTKEGELPLTWEEFVDLTRDSIGLDELPDELMLPDEPPQASGQDIAGVEVAAAATAPIIGSNDLQTFLVSATAANYRPGDWLEPKDGGNQRMMIVSVGQSGPVAASAPAPRVDFSLGTESAVPAPRLFVPTDSVLQIQTHALAPLNSDVVADTAPRFRETGGGAPLGFKTTSFGAPYTISGFEEAWAGQSGAIVPSATGEELMQLAVVCMQQEQDIPARGTRYFSAAKAAEGTVQLCQKQCVLNQNTHIQRCVWECETETE